MDPYTVAGMAFMCIGFLFVGVSIERKSWLMRALTREHPGGSAHHCDGKFYYVVSEDVFVHDYQRRPSSLRDNEPCEPPF